MNVRFILRKVTPREWVIVDESVAENDPRRPVACIYATGRTGFSAIWLRELNLDCGGFSSPQEALDHARRAAMERPRSTRPVPSAHVPPPGYEILA